MASIKSVEACIDKLRGKWNKDTFSTLTDVEKNEEDYKLSELKLRREHLKSEYAEASDVKDSLVNISAALPDVDLSKAAVFAAILIQNRISKWELHVATAEIIRSRTKFTAVAEYFLAINRIKHNLKGSGNNIFHDKALDF